MTTDPEILYRECYERVSDIEIWERLEEAGLAVDDNWESMHEQIATEMADELIDEGL